MDLKVFPASNIKFRARAILSRSSVVLDDLLSTFIATSLNHLSSRKQVVSLNRVDVKHWPIFAPLSPQKAPRTPKKFNGLYVPSALEENVNTKWGDYSILSFVRFLNLSGTGLCLSPDYRFACPGPGRRSFAG